MIAVEMLLVANITIILLAFHCSRKETLRIIGACLIISALTNAYRYVTGNPIGLMDFLPGVLYVPCLHFIRKGSMLQKIFFCFAITSTSHFLYIGVFCITEHSLRLRFLLLTCVLLLYVILAAWKGRQFIETIFDAVDQRAWKWYALYMVSLYFVMVRLYRTEIRIPEEFYARRFFYTLPIFAFIGIVMVFVTLTRTYQKAAADYELRFARESLCAGQEFYTQLTDALEHTRILRHDYKHQLAALETLLEQGKRREALEHHRQMVEAYSRQGAISYCGNPVIDALIIHYARRMEENAISFTFLGGLPDGLAIDNYELCIVVGNLLENAVDACRRVSDKDRRTVSLTVRCVEKQLVFRVENSFDGSVLRDGDGFISMKQEGGLGIRSVQAVAKKHRGDLRTEWTKDRFTCYVMLGLSPGPAVSSGERNDHKSFK